MELLLLQDTVISLLSYCDAIALRHPVKGAATAAAGVASGPVLNAGDGVGEHPTQALLDLYTIVAELGGGAGLEGLRAKVRERLLESASAPLLWPKRACAFLFVCFMSR